MPALARPRLRWRNRTPIRSHRQSPDGRYLRMKNITPNHVIQSNIIDEEQKNQRTRPYVLRRLADKKISAPPAFISASLTHHPRSWAFWTSHLKKSCLCLYRPVIEPRRTCLAAREAALWMEFLQLDPLLFQRALSSGGGRKGSLAAWAFVFIGFRVRRGRRSLESG